MSHPDWAWIGGVLMVGNITISDTCPTACTDGRNVTYGTAFMDKQDEPKLRGLVVHEALHKAFMHLVLYKDLTVKYSVQQVNVAMDYVINSLIMKSYPFMDLPEGGYYDPRYDDDSVWHTVAVLKDLMANPPPPRKGGGGQADPSGFDEHDWENAQEMTPEEAQAHATEIEQAIRQGRIMADKLKGSFPRAMTDILTPTFDPMEVLREWMTEVGRGKDLTTWRRPNKKYSSMGIYRPSRYSEKVESILFACDMSGSIGAREQQEVLSAVFAFVEAASPDAVDIMYWDTHVAKHEHYEGIDARLLVSSTKPEGGGGTSPSCVVDYCRAQGIKPALCVWLSDGCVGNDWAEALGCPAFWVITPGGMRPAHLPHVLLRDR